MEMGWGLLGGEEGMMTGAIVTTGNISAEKSGSVILQCHLSSTMAQVTQVNWKQQDQLLAICDADLGWHIFPDFRDRVAPGPGLGLTLHSLNMNDTGEYFCIYHTYPDGTYTGRIFLEVRESSGIPAGGSHSGTAIPQHEPGEMKVQISSLWLLDPWGERSEDALLETPAQPPHKALAEHSARFQILLLGATAATLVVICTAVIGVVVLARKLESSLLLPCTWAIVASLLPLLAQNFAKAKKSLRTHSVESGLQRLSAGQEERSLSAPSSPGSCVQAEAAPVGLCGEQGGDGCAELHDYFNVLSYRSLGSFFTETG
ncbi:hypothetical protein P7K49_031096 [Saguinus oedipus]|uniref:Ig-like domain-containing protein n=1 Tax=Saguinus oedipus TaxID=9490 RepID=A0ABQ9U415_SAGOE|nr:hypothetical protein P7K49_031096 [Saguinus oedipus]